MKQSQNFTIKSPFLQKLVLVFLLLGSLLRIDALAGGRSNPGLGLFLPQFSGKHLSA